jgi:hypothetical protein
VENDGPLFQITHIDRLPPRGGISSYDIGGPDRHLCSVALFGESLDGLKGLHSLNERKLLLTDGRDCTRCQNLNPMGEGFSRCAVPPHRYARVVLQGIGAWMVWTAWAEEFGWTSAIASLMPRGLARTDVADTAIKMVR